MTVEALEEGGHVVATHAGTTSGRPDARRTKLASRVIAKERGLAKIELQIVDEKGNPVFFADNEINCRVKGPVRFLGMESGSNTDMTHNKANRKRVYQGKLIAYVQATGQPGEAFVEFTSPWLQQDTVSLIVE